MIFYLLIVGPLVAIALADLRRGVRPFTRLYKRDKR